MIPPPSIETDRLTLRFPEPVEASAVLDYFLRNRAHLEPWSPRPVTEFYTIDYWERTLYQNVIHSDDDRHVRFFIFSNDDAKRVIGSCNVNNIVRGVFQACHLGYGLDRDAVGNGIMGEAIDAVVTFCFQDLNLHRVMANYMPENEKSAAVLERCGFVKEGVAKDYLRINGAWRDHVLTSRTNADWTARK